MSAAPATTQVAFDISPMTEHDLLEVVGIEEQSGLSRWGWDAYHKELQAKDQTIMLVARVQSDLASHNPVRGFIAGRLNQHELHINNMAVHVEYRRGGIGTALLDEAISCASRLGAREAYLEVRVSNRAARALYEKNGFRISGRRRNYYARPPEDAFVMRRAIKGWA